MRALKYTTPRSFTANVAALDTDANVDLPRSGARLTAFVRVEVMGESRQGWILFGPGSRGLLRGWLWTSAGMAGRYACRT